MDTNIQEIVQDFEVAVSKIVLYCIAELPFPLGMKKTISVLQGSKSSFVIKHGLYELETFALLPMFSGEQLNTIIEGLIEAELIYVGNVSDNKPVLKISPKGHQFLEGMRKEKVQFLESIIDKTVPLFDGKDADLLDALAIMRLKIAQVERIPAYTVCGDTVIRELTKQKPANMESLLAVKGVGNKFADNYGDLFLKVIIEHISGSGRGS